MTNTTFLQSETDDPFVLYRKMLSTHPFYWDERNRVWAVYSYALCHTVLNDARAVIPDVHATAPAPLSPAAMAIVKNLARLSNAPHHATARAVAMVAFEALRPVAVADTLSHLLDDAGDLSALDWVEAVAKKVPVQLLLRGFNFSPADVRVLSDTMPRLVKIMQPAKTPEQVLALNQCAHEVYAHVEQHILTTGLVKNILSAIPPSETLNTAEAMTMLVSNIIGLFIQSYDAGRGMLSNTLLQWLQRDTRLPAITHRDGLYRFVCETTRYAPTIHNTRRVAAEDITLNGHVIPKGETMLVVMAAANRDPLRFEHPDTFDIYRSNNDDNLTFGSGAHQCLAKHFMRRLVTETLVSLFDRYKNIALHTTRVTFEPLVNARIPAHLIIALKP
ncbi:cytochrome P450 [Chryseolinea lacunae]|uniref:Cytochrome P450 n=1 Tax=Chryseolinea lacunae TaxID=2801331 RepID=A0ABS1KJV4_9BACT|nr:cytochrome P450 [Chryseolinea lacunae]MBL0739725.1 cytochrome P450 [Chryseolinea lacunae]